jgi:hypothetical protein
MIFNHRDGRDEAAHPSVDKQAGYARLFFPGTIGQASRAKTLEGHQKLYLALRSLPLSFHAAANQLEMVRRDLVNRYKRAEAATTEINQDAFQGIHDLILQRLATAKDTCGEVQLCSLPCSSTSKRSRENSVADSRAESSGATSPTPKSKPKKANLGGK